MRAFALPSVADAVRLKRPWREVEGLVDACGVLPTFNELTVTCSCDA